MYVTTRQLYMKFGSNLLNQSKKYTTLTLISIDKKQRVTFTAYKTKLTKCRLQPVKPLLWCL